VIPNISQLEKAKPWTQEIDHWLPGVGEEKWLSRRNTKDLKWCNYSV
jgi:hypothetical protein